MRNDFGVINDLCKAVIKEDVNTVRSICNNTNINPAAPNVAKISPLHYAASKDTLRMNIILAFLINIVVQNVTQDKTRSLPQSHFQSRLEENQIIGKTLGPKDIKGNTPFHLACVINNNNAMDMLGQRGADRHARNNAGETPGEYRDRVRGWGEELRTLSL
jgi:ankyrin repeat protein